MRCRLWSLHRATGFLGTGRSAIWRGFRECRAALRSGQWLRFARRPYRCRFRACPKFRTPGCHQLTHVFGAAGLIPGKGRFDGFGLDELRPHRQHKGVRLAAGECNKGWGGDSCHNRLIPTFIDADSSLICRGAQQRARCATLIVCRMRRAGRTAVRPDRTGFRFHKRRWVKITAGWYKCLTPSWARYWVSGTCEPQDPDTEVNDLTTTKV